MVVLFRKIKKQIFTVFAVIISFAILSTFTLSAETEPDGKRLFDDKSVFGTEECESLNALLLETEEETGFTVSLVVTDNVGGEKSDAGVVEYADLYYEKYFGIDTDGIFFIINDDTLYDYISTSGICIRYFTDERIDRVHQAVKPYLKDENYAGAVEKYAEQVLYYYKQGIPSNQHNNYEDGSVDYYNKSYSEKKSEYTLEEQILMGAAGGFVISLTIIIIMIVTIKKRYEIKRAKNAVDYLDRSSIRYTQRSDTFVRKYINRRRIDTDSHNGGGGGGSSVHTSSGGGSHGGGGSHR